MKQGNNKRKGEKQFYNLYTHICLINVNKQEISPPPLPPFSSYSWIRIDSVVRQFPRTCLSTVVSLCCRMRDPGSGSSWSRARYTCPRWCCTWCSGQDDSRTGLRAPTLTWCRPIATRPLPTAPWTKILQTSASVSTTRTKTLQTSASVSTTVTRKENTTTQTL